MPNLVRSELIHGLDYLLEEFGKNPKEITHQLGLDPKIFKDPDSRIRGSDFVNILNYCERETQCHTFGLLLGSRKDLQHYLGIVGDLARSASTLGDAVKKVIRYFEIQSEISFMQIESQGNVSYLLFTMAEEFDGNIEQVQQLTIARSWGFINALTNHSWHPTMVAFPFLPNGSKNDYQRYFSVPILFDADYCGIVFRRSDLNIKINSSNIKFHEQIQRKADDYLHKSKRDFVDTVRILIRKNLEVQRVNESEITSFFPFTQRTFQRRLRQEGTNYQTLLTDARMSMAQNMLSNSSTSVTRIAIRLGYSDIATFTHAFTRHIGVPPTEWRNKS